MLDLQITSFNLVVGESYLLFLKSFPISLWRYRFHTC